MKTVVGIDPGVNTGFAVLQNGALVKVSTMKIHEALRQMEVWFAGNNDFIAYVEDARQRGGKQAAARLAGSIRRDCKIWEDFLVEHKIPHVFVKPTPHGMTKLDAKTFERLTGWRERTNEHGRDAAMLIWGRHG